MLSLENHDIHLVSDRRVSKFQVVNGVVGKRWNKYTHYREPLIEHSNPNDLLTKTFDVKGCCFKWHMIFGKRYDKILSISAFNKNAEFVERCKLFQEITAEGGLIKCLLKE